MKKSSALLAGSLAGALALIVCLCPRVGGEEGLGNKCAYMELPELTDLQRHMLATKADRNRDAYRAEADRQIRDFSAKLESYIRKWLDGKAAAAFPQGFLPPYIDSRKTHDWRLARAGEITPQEQWYCLPAYDPSQTLYQFSPEPHGTYGKLIFLAPLGSKLIIEGEFPHARFLDFQILTPVDPDHPVTGQMGIGEVPIVDADIDPLPGHVNPFRGGADRHATKRSYRVEFDLRAGNALDLNPQAMKAPAYRAPGNTRVGGPFAFTGPYGGNVLVPSVLWMRIYAPDSGTGPLGGVSLPRATLQLPSGEQFWITCDKSVAVSLQTRTLAPYPIPPREPYPFIGPSIGWFKMYGIMNMHAEARAYYQSRPWGRDDPEERRQRIRESFRLIFNQGGLATPPGSNAAAATENNYNSYLIRPMCLGERKVIVLTGKLPTFPRTRNNESTMTGGEVRFFSITHQLGASSERGNYGTPYGTLMDDEIVVNNRNEYIIVYSRPEDRPANATPGNGVTWQAWGAPSTQNFVLRWLSVMPEWHLPRYAPDEGNLPWERGAWSGTHYDSSLLGQNRPGFMGPYHPVIHYLSSEEFERLGNNLTPARIPEWRERRP